MKSRGFSRTASIVEPLERRTLLALVGPFPITVSIFNDLNRNGMRNSNEPAMTDWGVIAYELRDSSGAFQRSSGRTDKDGKITFNDWIFDEFETPSARIYVEPNKRLFSTTHQRTNSGWFGVSGDYIEFGLTDVAPITGKLANSYRLADGTFSTTPLAARLIYEDANLNGKMDSNEKSAVTDLEGNYTMWLRTGTHVLRAEPGVGWTAKAGEKLVRRTTVYPYQAFPTFSATMIAPTIIDVLAAYTPAAQPALQMRSISDLFREANRVYANSNTNVTINLVGSYLTNYTESGSIDTDLKRLQNASDGILDDVQSERNRVRADLTVLLTSRAKTMGEVVGLAYQYAAGRGGDRFGFSVVTIDNFDRGFTLAHELGHNLGAGHDVATANDDGDAPIKPYAYGYRFGAGEPRRVYKDVMAYGGGVTLPFFSTPLFKWQGKPIGNPDNADNARIIKEIAPLVAAYR